MAKRTVIRGPVPTTTVHDIGDLTNRLDPQRNLPSTAYRFSNGREFDELPGESYEEEE